MLKIGILGAGRAAAAHSDGITKSGLGQVTKIYAPGDGAAIAPRYGARPAHSAEEIFGDPSIDAVVIASPTDTHLDYLRSCQASGKHVLCEVPLVRTSAEADQLEELLSSLGTTVAAGALLSRFDAPIIQLKKSIEAGDLGEIGTVRLGHLAPYYPGDGNWYGDFSQSGGVTLKAMPYLIDAVRYCFGSISRLYAQRGPETNDLSSDYALLVGRLESGALVHLEASWTESGNDAHHYYEIAGSQGLLDYDTRKVAKIKVQGKKAAELTGAAAATEGIPPCSSGGPTPHQLLAEDFLRAVQEKRSSSVPLTEALIATRLALKALESANSGAVLASR